MTKRRQGGSLAGLLLTVHVAITACAPGATPASSASGSSPGMATPAPYARERTPWEVELANLGPDGTPSLESALRLFAMAFGPIPGVDVPRSAPGEVMTATPAIHAVRAHWADLTPEQRAAIERHLTVADEDLFESATTARVQVASLGGAAFLAPPDAMLMGTIVKEIQRLHERFQEVVGEAPFTMQIGWADEDSNDTNDYPFLSTAVIHEVTGDPNAVRCTIEVTPIGLTQPWPRLQVSLAHDVFYCGAEYVVHQQTSTGAFYGVPRWVVDGAAHYFALSETGAPYELAWKDYLLGSDSIPLFQRRWDAIGFWSHLQYTFGNVYEAFLSASLVPGALSVNNERFAATGADSAEFLDTWAAGMYREGLNPTSGYGPSWNTDGPSLPPELQGAFGFKQLANGVVDIVDQQPFTNIHYAIHSSADLLRFEFEGRPRLGDGKGVDTTLLAEAVFCTRLDGCPPCPTDPNAQQYPKLAPESTLAISGGMDGTHGTISGEKLPPCESAPPSFCPTGPSAADDGGSVAFVTWIETAPCSPPPDEFCNKYRDYVAWGEALGPDTDVTQELAREIARRFKDMQPVAPEELRDDVVLVFAIYATFGRVPEPWNVPGAGHIAGPSGMAKLPGALKAMHAYCGIPWPEI